MTDLDTINHVLCTNYSTKHSISSASSSSRGRGQWPLIKYAQNINLTLRLPLRMLSTLFLPLYSNPSSFHLEWLEVQPKPLPRPFAILERSGYKREHDQWMRIWPALLELPHLRRFTLWLDHKSDYGWNMVGERDTLQSLSDMMPVLKSRNVQVIVKLPKLFEHEWITDSEYFIKALPDSELQRRIRLPVAKGAKDWKYEVRWIYNEENGHVPTGFPRNQESSGLMNFMVFDELGYDVTSSEFAEHPFLGTLL